MSLIRRSSYSGSMAPHCSISISRPAESDPQCTAVYLKFLLDDPAAVHARLIDQWWQVSYQLPDRYAWKWIGWHLHQAREFEKLNQLLLSFHWLKARLENIDIQTLLQDFELLESSAESRMVRDALQLASHVLSRDRSSCRYSSWGVLTGVDHRLWMNCWIRRRHPKPFPGW